MRSVSHMKLVAALFSLMLAGCSAPFVADAPDAGTDAGPAPTPFLACQVLTAGEGGLDTLRNYTCGDPGVIGIRWGWDGASMAGSCASPGATCATGSPCTVATADSYEQGGCL